MTENVHTPHHAAPRRAIEIGNAARCHAHDGKRAYAAPRRAIAVWCGVCPFPVMCMAPCCVANLDGAAGRGGCVVACCGCLVSSVHGAAPGCGVCSEGAA